jgi:hypothetical protein
LWQELTMRCGINGTLSKILILLLSSSLVALDLLNDICHDLT